MIPKHIQATLDKLEKGKFDYPHKMKKRIMDFEQKMVQREKLYISTKEKLGVSQTSIQIDVVALMLKQKKMLKDMQEKLMMEEAKRLWEFQEECFKIIPGPNKQIKLEQFEDLIFSTIEEDDVVTPQDFYLKLVEQFIGI